MLIRNQAGIPEPGWDSISHGLLPPLGGSLAVPGTSIYMALLVLPSLPVHLSKEPSRYTCPSVASVKDLSKSSHLLKTLRKKNLELTTVYKKWSPHHGESWQNWLLPYGKQANAIACPSFPFSAHTEHSRAPFHIHKCTTKITFLA